MNSTTGKVLFILWIDSRTCCDALNVTVGNLVQKFSRGLIKFLCLGIEVGRRIMQFVTSTPISLVNY